MSIKKTPNNNPYLAAAIAFLLMVVVCGLFVLISSYHEEPTGGFGDDDHGTGVFGSGSGDGIGGAAGDNAGNDEKSTAPSRTEKGDTTTDEKTVGEDTEQKRGQETATDGEQEEEEEEVADVEIDEDLLKKIHLPESQAPQQRQKKAGRFSSGGKSVFAVKKNENVLFVIDISPSMGATNEEGLSRLEVLKIQLKSTLQSQCNKRSKGKYAILAFSPITKFEEADRVQFKFNSKSDLTKANEWIDRLRYGSGTFLYPALKNAVTMINEKKIKVNTIFLLTDGLPTDGMWGTDYVALLKLLPKGIKVNTISIGTTSTLLKTIADECNGKYEEYQ